RSGPFIGHVVQSRPEATDRLAPGALLLLYSDGLVERRRESITVGLERLERAAVANRTASLQQLCDRVMAALGVDESRDDDVVVLCVRQSATAVDRFHLFVPAVPKELRSLRAALREWLQTRADQAQTDDLLIAVGEAAANAVEHAYLEGARGRIDVV